MGQRNNKSDYAFANSTALYMRGNQRSGSIPAKLKDAKIDKFLPIPSHLFNGERVTYIRGGGAFTLFLTGYFSTILITKKSLWHSILLWR
jgi:hypothetical protein